MVRFGFRFAADSAFPIERKLWRTSKYGEDSEIEEKLKMG